MLEKYKRIDIKVQHILHISIYEMLVLTGCILAAIIMLIRVYYGTEITDEAYYISDAIAMIHGNIPYAYNNYSYGTGSAFLIIPFVFIYELIVPDNEGLFLYTRICFMVFWYIVLIFGYIILKKDFKRSSALLVTGFLIPYAGGGYLFNFSYNTIPCALAYISGLLIYDAIEHKNKYSSAKLISSGFILGIAILAHPGYITAVAVFALVIFIRSSNIKEKFHNILYCLIGGITEMLVVLIPIILQTGLSVLLAGIDNKLHPYLTESTYTGTLADKMIVLTEIYKENGIYLFKIFLFMLIFSLRYIREKERRLPKKEYVFLGVSTAVFFLTVTYCQEQIQTNGNNANWQWGFLGSIVIMIMLLFVEFKKYPVILYLGIYPVIYSFAVIAGVDSSALMRRFIAAVPALAVYFLIMLDHESELIRVIITTSVVGCILAMGINQYKYVYRDEHISALDYKVETGIYKGIYTTEARAGDLPELEEYLNSIVNEDEYYAFRDNVPAGYLMMHRGIMCDKATWDCMNYSYGKNSPANLYEFYQRRGAFPQKYIYIDYGADESLSIENEDYKFNEFIKTYYKKTEDFILNSTFYHIVVYEYAGGFDGNFDYWIDRHMLREN